LCYNSLKEKKDEGNYGDGKALARIKSVLGAKIVTNAKGEIVEVHVLATDERNPKQVVRDVESTLLVKFPKRLTTRR